MPKRPMKRTVTLKTEETMKKKEDILQNLFNDPIDISKLDRKQLDLLIKQTQLLKTRDDLVSQKFVKEKFLEFYTLLFSELENLILQFIKQLCMDHGLNFNQLVNKVKDDVIEGLRKKIES